MSDPILALEALAPTDRPFLTIGGEPYYFRNPKEFNLSQIAKLGSLDSAWSRAKVKLSQMSDAELDETEVLLADLVSLILEAPDEVLANLTAGQRVEIVLAYRDFKIPASPNRKARRKRSTSARSSRVSPGSTATTPG